MRLVRFKEGNMFNTWLLIIVLFGGSIIGFGEGISKYSDYRSLNYSGITVKAYQDTTMKAEENPKRVSIIDGEDRFEVFLQFMTYDKKVVYVTPHVPKRLVDKLANDGFIELVYNAKNPRFVIFKGEKLEKGYSRFMFGFLLGFLFIIVLKSRYRIAPFLGRVNAGG